MSETLPLVVLLYYKYVEIENPDRFVKEHRKLCESLNLKGRILVAEEGINGTLVGDQDATDRYQAAMKEDPRFADMEFKISHGDATTFPKLVIKARKEIVTLGLEDDVDPITGTGVHLSPQQWKEMLDTHKDEVVVFDARNRYESDVGYFEGAIKPDIEHFRDLPDVVDEYAHLKDKKVMMYCTGGIRCEKATALFKERGFKDVYQLHGGIVTYLEKVGRDHWEGDCFVFDQRMVVPDEFALAEEPVGQCEHTGVRTRHFTNCLHVPCHRLFVVEPKALEEHPEYGICSRCTAAGVTLENVDHGGNPAPQAAG